MDVYPPERLIFDACCIADAKTTLQSSEETAEGKGAFLPILLQPHFYRLRDR